MSTCFGLYALKHYLSGGQNNSKSCRMCGRKNWDVPAPSDQFLPLWLKKYKHFKYCYFWHIENTENHYSHFNSLGSCWLLKQGGKLIFLLVTCTHPCYFHLLICAICPDRISFISTSAMLVACQKYILCCGISRLWSLQKCTFLGNTCSISTLPQHVFAASATCFTA